MRLTFPFKHSNIHIHIHIHIHILRREWLGKCVQNVAFKLFSKRQQEESAQNANMKCAFQQIMEWGGKAVVAQTVVKTKFLTIPVAVAALNS